MLAATIGRRQTHGSPGAAAGGFMGDLVSALEDIVGTANVSTGAAIAEDLTHDEAITALAVIPAAVVRPASTEEVAAIVAAAVEHGVPLTARGSGTGLSGACIPQPD